jgi:hypothetical protein
LAWLALDHKRAREPTTPALRIEELTTSSFLPPFFIFHSTSAQIHCQYFLDYFLLSL